MTTVSNEHDVLHAYLFQIWTPIDKATTVFSFMCVMITESIYYLPRTLKHVKFIITCCFIHFRHRLQLNQRNLAFRLHYQLMSSAWRRERACVSDNNWYYTSPFTRPHLPLGINFHYRQNYIKFFWFCLTFVTAKCWFRELNSRMATFAVLQPFLCVIWVN